MGLSVTLLGTGNPIPDPNRAGAASLIEAGSTRILVDAGRAVCMRMVAAGALPIMLDAVLLTHLHSDHLCDLNDVVTSHWVMGQQPKVLPIYGPTGTKQMVDGMLAMLASDVRYRLAHHPDLTWEPQLEVHEIADGTLSIGEVSVIVEGTDHRPVEPSLGYRFEHEGKSVVIAGDTVPCEGLDRLCVGADVYVQTVLNEAMVKLVPMQRFQDTIDYHSTLEQTADTASRQGVKTLVLTHQIPTPMVGSDDSWLEAVAASYTGTVVFGSDLTRIEA
jgi:ribonuclease Z